MESTATGIESAPNLMVAPALHPNHGDIEVVVNALEDVQIDEKSFPFLKLPGELRNRIYELLLNDTCGPRHFFDTVILINDLRRRSARRAATSLLPMSTGLSKKSFQLAKTFYMYNHYGDVNTARLGKRVTELPSLLETAILRVCRQTDTEGTAVLFQMNTFAIIVPIMKRNFDLESWFPRGLEFSLVRHLRLEYQMQHIHGKTQGYSADFYTSTTPWIFLRRKKSLRTLRLIVTFDDERNAPGLKETFERLWHTMRLYRQLMQELFAAIPKGVEVKLGLTKEEKALGDHGGFCPVRASVLRKIYKTNGAIQGADVDMLSKDEVDMTNIEKYPIDGDGDDSDESDESDQENKSI